MILTKKASEQLKGFAILLVIIGHLFILGYLNPPFEGAKIAASWGVSTFLILSGYGLVKSTDKTKTKYYFMKRLLKILLPYFLVTFVWILIDYFYLTKVYSLKTAY